MNASSALNAADPRALLLAVVQLTGDTAPLTRLRAALDAGEPARVTDEEASALRAIALEWLDRRSLGTADLAPPPSTSVLLDMMSVSAGQLLPPEYLPLLLDEAAFYDTDPRAFCWEARPPEETLHEFHVLVVGAGMSGLCAGARLHQAGIPFTIVERNNDVGGTWLENQYPGCGVDTPNHLYSYSFVRNPAWPRHYSKRDEILGYFQRCAEDLGLRDHIRFGTEVTSAAFDESKGTWSIDLRNADGSVSRATANVLISAVGMLNQPRIPSVEGLATFTGHAFHSARWPDELDITEQRVGIVGTGASAVQIGPTIADDAAEVRVFQRTPAWVMADPTYHREVSPEAQWLFANLPFYAGWYRFRLLWLFGDRVHGSLTTGQDDLRARLVQHLARELDGRPDLIEQTTPSFPPYGKRMLLDNRWFEFLRRDDVRLVTSGIERVDRGGIVTVDGDHHELDVIVFATGFDATNVLGSLDLRGRSGQALRDRWADGARAYLGISIPDFPNLFCLYGPNTNLAYGGSAIFHTECQVNYVMGCVRAMLERGWKTLECRSDAHDQYNAQVDEANERMPWARAEVGNWFKDRNGRVVTNSPWRMLDYWAWTKEPNFADFVVDRR